MPSQPRVTVIIAAHNAAATLPRAISSVLGQTEQALEVVVVDDASTDATAGVVADATGVDCRVRYLKTKCNVGPSAARNLAIEAATGEWIAILDADDWCAPDRLRVLVAAGEAAMAEIVSDGIEVFDERTGRTAGPMFKPGEVPPLLSTLAFVGGNLPKPGHSRAGLGFLKPIIRRQFLIDAGLTYDSNMRFAEDYRLYLELLLHGARWVTVAENFYYYAVRTDSLTARHKSEDLDRLRDFERAVLDTPTRRLGRELRTVLSAHYRTLDERYHDAVFAESIARRHLGDALSAMTRSPLAFRCCARRAIKGLARRAFSSRARAEAA